MAAASNRMAFRTAAAYAFVAGSWIFASDRICTLLFTDTRTLAWVQMFKGWGFVLVTSLLLFLAMRRQFQKWEQANQALDAAERTARESTERLRLALSAANVGLWDWDLITNRVVFSPEYKRQIGYQDDELAGSFEEWRTRLHPDDVERSVETVQRFLQSPWPDYRLEFRLRHRDGSYRWILAQASVIQDDQGCPVRMLGSHVDITESKRTEETLRRQATMLDQCFDAVFAWEPGGRIVYWNRGAEKLYGFPSAEAVGNVSHELLETVFPQGVQECESALARSGQWQGELRQRGADGRWLDVESRMTLVREAGAVLVLEVNRDVTKRKKAEEDLRQRAEELAVLNEFTPRCVQSLSLEEVIHSCLDGMLEAAKPDAALLFLREDGQLRLRGIASPDGALKPDGIPAHRVGECLCGLALQEKEAIYSQDIFSDSRCTWEECKKAGFRSFGAIPLRAHGAIIGVLGLAFRAERDLGLQARFLETLSSQASIALQNALLYEESRRRLEMLNALYAGSRSLAESLDLEEVSETVVRACVDGLGAKLCWLAEARPDGAMGYITHFPKDIRYPKQMKVRWDECPEGQGPTGRAVRSGRPVVIPDLERAREFLPWREQALESGFRTSAAFPLIGKEKVFGTLNLYSGEPGFFTPERIEFFESFARQAAAALENARLYAEIQALASDLERRVEQRTAEIQTKNRELETFAYSVSHDLKAPLRGIDGYSRLLLEDHTDRLDEEGRTFVHTIRQAVLQKNQLIDGLLAYSRLEIRPPQAGVMDLEGLTRALVHELASEIREQGAEVRVNLPSTKVIGDPDGLALVLRNLLGNALKFSRQAQQPVIEVGGEEKEAGFVLWVRDNGVGFDMKFHDRIFDMFQRLHRSEDYPGTGVGLAIVRKAMERMGGRVWAESEAGKGATFFVEIPKAEEAP